MKGYPQNAYKEIWETEHHLHTHVETYGNVSGLATHNIPVKFTVTGGDLDWGTELHVHAGDVFGGGDATKYFDLNILWIVSVSSANEISIFKMTGYSSGSDIACVTDEGDDTFTAVGHGLLDNDRVIVTDLTTTTGVDAVTVYHVVNVAGDDFELSLTQGGATVTLTDDGTGTVQKLTEKGNSTIPVSASNVNSDTFATPLPTERYSCDTHIGISALSESGETIAIGFLFNLHLYDR